MFVIYLLLYFLPILVFSQNERISVYIAKMDWHVGILVEINEEVIEKIEAAKDFNEFEYIDIGWGDADFYQSPESFDLYLATKAILIPTSSVVRIQGYNWGINDIIKWRDYAFKIDLTYPQFGKFCDFINRSFLKDNENKLLVTSVKFKGAVKFYSSSHSYHVMNTCNTWVAEGLEVAGKNIESSDVTTAEELFMQLLNIGKLIKAEQPK